MTGSGEVKLARSCDKSGGAGVLVSSDEPGGAVILVSETPRAVAATTAAAVTAVVMPARSFLEIPGAIANTPAW
jgi:hypothetical protein